MAESHMPILTDDMRKAASKKAVECRQRRAVVRKQLREGELSIPDLLEMDDEIIKRLPVRLVLSSFPSIGKIKAQKIMDELGISYNRRIGGLGKHQKNSLCNFSKKLSK